MNGTYDGNVFVCPDGSDEWQDGYRDAMGHYARKGVLFAPDGTSDYNDGYMTAIVDMLDHHTAGE